MKYRILLMGNTVEMAGGDIYVHSDQAEDHAFCNAIQLFYCSAKN